MRSLFTVVMAFLWSLLGACATSQFEATPYSSPRYAPGQYAPQPAAPPQDVPKDGKRGNTPPGQDRTGGGPAEGAILDPTGAATKQPVLREQKQ